MGTKSIWSSPFIFDVPRMESTCLPSGVKRGYCHGRSLHERNGNVVIADLLSKVAILDRKNNVVASLGEGEYSNKDWSAVRNQAPGTFVPGRFVCPHGACFDHEGNIFVVEWVEAGRVTKLRKVA